MPLCPRSIDRTCLRLRVTDSRGYLAEPPKPAHCTDGVTYRSPRLTRAGQPLRKRYSFPRFGAGGLLIFPVKEDKPD